MVYTDYGVSSITLIIYKIVIHIHHHHHHSHIQASFHSFCLKNLSRASFPFLQRRSAECQVSTSGCLNLPATISSITTNTGHAALTVHLSYSRMCWVGGFLKLILEHQRPESFVAFPPSRVTTSPRVTPHKVPVCLSE